jgi:hypothetical protein
MRVYWSVNKLYRERIEKRREDEKDGSLAVLRLSKSRACHVRKRRELLASCACGLGPERLIGVTKAAKS